MPFACATTVPGWGGAPSAQTARLLLLYRLVSFSTRPGWPHRSSLPQRGSGVGGMVQGCRWVWRAGVTSPAQVFRAGPAAGALSSGLGGPPGTQGTRDGADQMWPDCLWLPVTSPLQTSVSYLVEPKRKKNSHKGSAVPWSPSSPASLSPSCARPRTCTTAPCADKEAFCGDRWCRGRAAMPLAGMTPPQQPGSSLMPPSRFSASGSLPLVPGPWSSRDRKSVV